MMFAWNVSAQSTDLYWDLNGTEPGASGSTTAAGTWNDTNTYWNTDSTGGDGGTIGAWQEGAVAVFSAGSNATGTFAVSVSGTHQIGGLQFEQGAVSVNEGALQFSGGATFTHLSGAGDCHVNSAVQGNGLLTLDGSGSFGRINGVVSEYGGTLSVHLKGASWVFGGQHTYTGGTTVTGYAVLMLSSTGSASSGDLTSGPFGTGTVVLKSGTLRPTLDVPITTGNAVTLDGNFTFGVSGNTGALTFTGPLTLTGTRTLTTIGSDVYFDGVLGDGGKGYGFIKSGTSALVLGGNNTFTGAVTINDGTITLANAGALNSTAPVAVSFGSNANTKMLQLGGHSVTVSGLTTGATVGTSIVENNAAGTATLTVNNAAANTFAGVLRDGAAGTLALTKTGGGTLTFSGSSPNTYIGLTTVSAGTLELNKTPESNAIAGDIVVNGGALTLAANHQIADTSDITVNGSANFNSNDKTETVRNVTLNSSYSTPLQHRVANMTITETLTVTKGVVGLTSGTTTSAKTVSMSGGSRMDMAANTGDTIFNIGDGGLTMSGATLRFGWTGLGSAETAQVNLGGDFTGSGMNHLDYLNPDNPRLLDLQGATRTFNITSDTTTIAPTIQNGGLTKTGAGTLVLTGNNTYTGPTSLDAGILRITNAGALGASADGVTVADGAQLELSGGITVSGRSLTMSGTGTNNRGPLQSVSGANTWTGDILLGANGTRIGAIGPGQTLTLSGAIGDGGNNYGLAVRNEDSGGTTILSGANTYGGDTEIVVGLLQIEGGNNRLPVGSVLRIGNSANVETATFDLNGYNQQVGGLVSLGTTMDMEVTNSSTDPATLTVNNASGSTYRGQITGNLALAKSGAGTLTLSGPDPNTYAGSTTVSAGTLELNKTPGANAIAGDIVVNGGALTLAANHQIADTSDITVNGAGRFNTGSSNYADTIRNLTMDSSVTDPNTNRVNNLTVTDTLMVKRGAVGVYSGCSLAAGTLDMSGGSIMGLAGNTADTTVDIGAGGLIMSGATLRFGWIWSGILDSPKTIRVNLDGNFTGSGTNSLDYVTTLGPRLLDLQGATRTFDIISDTTTISPTIQNGGLTKTGAGTLVLAGNNVYDAATTVLDGVLRVTTAGSLKHNGSDKVLIAANPARDFTAPGARLVREVAHSGIYDGLGSQITAGGAGTRADIGAGTNASGGVRSVAMAWREPDDSEPTPPGFIGLASDVLELSGMVISGAAHGETDPFVLTMSYDSAALLGREAELAATGNLYLAWLDPAQGWRNAALGNFGGANSFAGMGPWTDFIDGANLAADLGRWGVDPTQQYAWAVLNHNSEFAVMGVPEPASLLSLVAALSTIACLPRRMRQRAGR